MLISPLFPPTGNPQSLQSFRLAEALAGFGYAVTVVAGDSGSIRAVNNHAESALEMGAGITLLRPGRNASRFYRTLVGRKTYRFLRPWDSFIQYSQLVATVRSALERRQFSTVISIAEPLVSHAVVRRLRSHMQSATLACWFSDPLPNSKEAVRLGVRREAVNRLARWVLERASIIVTPTDEIRAQIQAIKPQTGAAFLTVPHCFRAVDWPWPPLRRHNPGPLTLLHSGALYHKRRPDVLLSAIDVIVKSSCVESGIKCIFQGAVEPAIEATFDSWRATSHVEVLRAGDFEDSKAVMQMADILVVIDVDSPRNVHLPSKVADYVGACKPILYIGSRRSPTCQVLSSVHPAFRQAKSVQEVVSAILELSNLTSLEPDQYRPAYDRFECGNVLGTLRARLETPR